MSQINTTATVTTAQNDPAVEAKIAALTGAQFTAVVIKMAGSLPADHTTVLVSIPGLNKPVRLWYSTKYSAYWADKPSRRASVTLDNAIEAVMAEAPAADAEVAA